MARIREDKIMKYVTYDSGLGYPQPAKFGRGVEHEDGTLTPPPGLSYFSVDDTSLTLGLDERFYTVTAVDTLTPKPQTEVDTITEQDALPAAKEAKQSAIDTNYQAAEDVPVNVGGFTFDANTKALSESMSVVVAVGEGYVLPGGFTWIDAIGIPRPTNAAGIKALFKKISIKHYQDAHNYAKLTKQVKAATTLAQVAAVVDW